MQSTTKISDKFPDEDPYQFLQHLGVVADMKRWVTRVLKAVVWLARTRA